MQAGTSASLFSLTFMKYLFSRDELIGRSYSGSNNRIPLDKARRNLIVSETVRRYKTGIMQGRKLVRKALNNFLYKQK